MDIQECGNVSVRSVRVHLRLIHEIGVCCLLFAVVVCLFIYESNVRCCLTIVFLVV